MQKENAGLKHDGAFVHTFFCRFNHLSFYLTYCLPVKNKNYSFPSNAEVMFFKNKISWENSLKGNLLSMIIVVKKINVLLHYKLYSIRFLLRRINVSDVIR